MTKFMKLLHDALKAIDIMIFGYPEEQEQLFLGVDVNEIWKD